MHICLVSFNLKVLELQNFVGVIAGNTRAVLRTLFAVARQPALRAGSFLVPKCMCVFPQSVSVLGPPGCSSECVCVGAPRWFLRVCLCWGPQVVPQSLSVLGPPGGSSFCLCICVGAPRLLISLFVCLGVCVGAPRLFLIVSELGPLGCY